MWRGDMLTYSNVDRPGIAEVEVACTPLDESGESSTFGGGKNRYSVTTAQPSCRTYLIRHALHHGEELVVCKGSHPACEKRGSKAIFGNLLLVRLNQLRNTAGSGECPETRGIDDEADALFGQPS
jgi:hypothetical protein